MQPICRALIELIRKQYIDGVIWAADDYQKDCFPWDMDLGDSHVPIVNTAVSFCTLLHFTHHDNQRHLLGSENIGLFITHGG